MDKIEILSKDVSEMKMTLAEVHTAVAGNPRMGQKGLAARVEDLEKTGQQEKNLKMQAKGAFIGAGMVAGATGWPMVKAFFIKAASIIFPL